MADLFAWGQSWLSEQLQQHASRPVTYVRGNHSVEVSATLGKSQFEQADAHGFRTISEVRDYLVPTAALILEGTRTLPQRGDVIIDQWGNTETRYEVVPVGNDPCYRFADPYQNLLRIHVRQVETDPV